MAYNHSMNLKQAMSELESCGSEQTRKIFRNHGAPENMFGVKIGDMKKIVGMIKVDQALAPDWPPSTAGTQEVEQRRSSCRGPQSKSPSDPLPWGLRAP